MRLSRGIVVKQVFCVLPKLKILREHSSLHENILTQKRLHPCPRILLSSNTVLDSNERQVVVSNMKIVHPRVTPTRMKTPRFPAREVGKHFGREGWLVV